MKATSFELIVRALNDANVRYMVVGGIAVIAHGYVRLTLDVDLLIQLDAANIIAALRALESLGYRPTVPVTPEQFANPALRDQWIREKEMKVLKLFSDSHRETSIDVFVSDPLGFNEAYKRVYRQNISEVLSVPFCSYEDLIKLKLLASRPKDLQDLDLLRKTRGET